MLGHIVHFLRYPYKREDDSETKLKETHLRLGGEEKIIFILRWMDTEMFYQKRIKVCNMTNTAKGTTCC